MAKIVTVHSFRGGTGKSNLIANMAALLARDGMQVGVMDTDIQSPGLHVLFGLKNQDVQRSLNDYLNGQSSIRDAAYPVLGGRLFLIPSSAHADDIVRVLREGYDIRLLTSAIHELIDALNLDVLLIDTHPGLNEETLLALAISSTAAIVLRPDSQDYEGTAVTLDVARSLDVPRLVLVINKVPSSFDLDYTKTRAETTFGAPVAAVIPHSDQLMALGSSRIFVEDSLRHPLTERFHDLAKQLVAA